MKKLKYIISLMLLLTVIGCTASTGYINENIDAFPPTEIENIKVYSKKPTEKNYIEIGYVAAHITSGASGDALKLALKKEAAKMGADAIIAFQLMGVTAEGIAVKFK